MAFMIRAEERKNIMKGFLFAKNLHIYIYQINRIYIMNMFLQNEKLKVLGFFFLITSISIYAVGDFADLFSFCMWKSEYRFDL